MDLKLPLGFHQMQGKLRWDKRSQPSSLQRTVIVTGGVLRSLMGGQACSHRVSDHPGTTRQTSNVAVLKPRTRIDTPLVVWHSA